MKHATASMKHPGGRPVKFNEASRPVTVTLPDRTLDQLRRVDGDRAKAIVKAVDAIVGTQAHPSPHVEVVEMAQGTGLLVVSSNRSLRSIPWLKMIEVAPMRHLLMIESGTPIEKVEITIMDLIRDARQAAPDELPMLESLRDRIGQLRRSGQISTAEILCIAMTP